MSSPCHIARHPLLVQYIAGAVSGVRSLAFTHRSLRVMLVLFDSSTRRCYERYVFDHSLPAYNDVVQPYTASAQAATHRTQPAQSASSAHQSASLQSELSQTVVKLSQCNSLLAPLPPDMRCSFTVLICRTHELQQQQYSESESRWLPVDVIPPALSVDSLSAPALIVPLRSIRTPLLNVEVYVEENTEKPRIAVDQADSSKGSSSPDL